MNRNFKKLIILILFQNLILNECSKNCSICDSNNLCLFCNVTSFYLLKNQSCLYSNIDFCEKLNIDGICQGCKKNYYQDPTTLLCIQVDPNDQIKNCYQYDTAISCKTCSTGYYIVGGICEAVPSPINGCKIYTTNDGTKCDICEDNFILSLDKTSCIGKSQNETCSNYNMVQCSKCVDGYVYNENKYLEEYFNLKGTNDTQQLMNFLMKYTFTHNFGMCQKIIDLNCQQAENAYICKICKDGYYLDTQKVCQENPKEGVKNCRYYQDVKFCKECHQGYFLKSIQECKQVEFIQNCKIYDPKANKTICTQCSEKFYLEEQLCKDRLKDIFNCKNYKVSEELCQDCQDRFILKSDFSFCFSTIANCESHIENPEKTGLLCTKCSEKYYYDSINNLCILGPLSMNCAEFDDKSTCKKCLNGFIKINGICSQHQTIDDCSIYSQQILNGCDQCDQSFMIFQNTNYCFKVDPIPHCSEYLNDKQCKSCSDGYFWVTYLICAPIPAEEHCLQRDPNSQTPQCIKCEINYRLRDGKCQPINTFLSKNCGKDNRNGSLLFTEYICDYCNENFYPQSFSNTIVCETQEILTNKQQQTPGCLIYHAESNQGDFDYKCIECQTGKFLNVTNNKCDDECDLTTKTHYLQYKYKPQIILKNVCKDKTLNCNVAGLTVQFNETCYICATTYHLTVTQFTDFTYFKMKNKETLEFFNIDQMLVNKYPVLSCTQITNLIDNCEVYASDGTEWGCIQCQWGYRGILETSKPFLQNCVSYSEFCDINSHNIGIDDPLMNLLFTCHKCKNEEQIPVLFMNTETQSLTNFAYQYGANTITDQKFQLECMQVNYTNFQVTQSKWSFLSVNSLYNPDQTQHCALAMANTAFISDSSDSFKENGIKNKSGVFCIACKPGYKPKFSTTVGLGFKVYECSAQEYCQSTTWFNFCENCQNGALWHYTQVAEKNMNYNCFENSSLNCMFVNKTSGNCIFCKKGYQHFNGKCAKIEIPFCDYYQPYTSDIALNQDNINNVYFYQIYSKVGCRQCQQNYFPSYREQDFQMCSVNSLWSLKTIIPIHFIENCKLIGTDVQQTIICNTCEDGYLLSNDFKKCLQKDNCLTPNNAGECLTCANKYYLQGGNCIEGTIENCLVYQTSEICSKCAISFYPKDGKCYPGTIKNCQFYQTQTQCIQCEDNYFNVNLTNEISGCFPKENKRNCKKYDISDISKNKLTCLECTDQFVILKSGDFLKSTCVQTQILNSCLSYDVKLTFETSSLQCLQCDSSFFYDLQKKECILRTYNESSCQVYNIQEDNCQTCIESYYLTSEKKCIPNPTGIIKCTKYKNKDVCEKCDSLHYLLDNVCNEIQSDQIIENCLFYETFNTCSQCKNGFFLNENTCTEGKIANCSVYADEKNCQECDLSYGIKISEEGLICDLKTIENCSLTVKNQVNVCENCNSGFYENDGLCQPVTTVIDNCLLYSNADNCKQCNPGFMLSIDFKQCKTGTALNIIDQNCEQSTEIRTFVCTGCNEGHILENGICVACKNFTIDNGCKFCNEKDDKCLMCYKDYYMKEDFTCEKWVDPPKEVPTTDEPTETKKQLLIKIVVYLLIVILQ